MDAISDAKGPLTAVEFFALGLDGGDMSAASRGTGLAYTTVHRASKGPVRDVDTAKRLAAWSRTIPSAQAAGVWIDAARSLGLDEPDVSPADLDVAPSPTLPPSGATRAA